MSGIVSPLVSNRDEPVSPVSGFGGEWIRSRGLAWGLSFASLAAAAAILFMFRDNLDKAHVALVFLLVVLASSASGGRVLGVAIAVAAFIIFDWFFLRRTTRSSFVIRSTGSYRRI